MFSATTSIWDRIGGITYWVWDLILYHLRANKLFCYLMYFLRCPITWQSHQVWLQHWYTLQSLSSYNFYRIINLHVSASPLLRFWLLARWPCHTDILFPRLDSDNQFWPSYLHANRCRYSTCCDPLNNFVTQVFRKRR